MKENDTVCIVDNNFGTELSYTAHKKQNQKWKDNK